MINISQFFEALKPHLNEKTRRLVAAALTIGVECNGKSVVSREASVSFREIRRGLKELSEPAVKSKGIRVKGGGRKKITESDHGIKEALLTLVDSTTRGDPTNPLLWTSKSLRILAAELTKQGHAISMNTVGSILVELGYSLQGNRKVLEGANHPDRNAQFEFINKRAKAFLRCGQPIISIDCKKHELVGNFKNNGKEYNPKGAPTKVKDHDFMDPKLGKAIPFGVYDTSKNEGYVNVGIDHDTSSFAVQTIRNWWYKMGYEAYPNAKRLMITADCGGSNGYRRRLWKVELAKFATETGLTINVCHLPVGTSKWNKIEHRLFSHITMNWRAKPLTSLEVIVNLIAATKTTSGLVVNCDLDMASYQKAIKVSDSDLNGLQIRKSNFHGEWNYAFLP